jgi:hypothetical protein
MVAAVLHSLEVEGAANRRAPKSHRLDFSESDRLLVHYVTLFKRLCML